jgi:formiminoglutamase
VSVLSTAQLEGLLTPAPAGCFESRCDPHDPRLGDRIQPLAPDSPRADVVLVGCPDEAGLLLNRGRAGARLGPDAIRAALYTLTVGCRPRLDVLRLVDAGNVRVSADQEETHRRLRAAVGELAKRAEVVILLGGSHELSCPGLEGYAGAGGGDLAVLLLDAHIDIRDLRYGLTNGSPFYALMERGVLAGEALAVVGAQPWANAPDYAEELTRRGGTIHWIDKFTDGRAHLVVASELTRLEGAHGELAMSVDIDVAGQASAPGTGAPGAVGLSPADLISCARLAGRCPAVGYLDVMEVSPPLDRDNRTANLAATIIFSFIAGLTEREK